MRIVAVLGMLAALTWGAPKWVEVTSPHFVVLSDGSGAQARDVAGQLERLRQVYQQTFPGLPLDELAPIEVLAVRNGKEFRTLEPSAYLAKGGAQLAGYFERSAEGNFILLRLDAPDGDGQFPNATVYHEYTHAVTTRSAAFLPPWLMEGLAEFYQTARIESQQVDLGLPDPQQLNVLRTHDLLPLATLMAVDQHSPYYHEENKIGIFYAESWALTHFLMEQQGAQGSKELAQYIALLQQHMSPVAAGSAAFGDLAKLQRQLGNYVHQQEFHYRRLKLRTAVDEKSFGETPAASSQADAMKAEMLANVGRLADATAMARQTLREDAGDASAYVTLAMVALRQQDQAAAQRNFALAVQYGTTNYFAQLRYAQLTLRQGAAALDPPTAMSVAGALQRAIQINPREGAAYDMLASLHAARHEQPDQVDRLQLEAISADPDNFNFRYNRAVVLMNRRDMANAILVLNAARPIAANAAEVHLCDQALQQAAHYQDYQKAQQAYQQALAAVPKAEAATAEEAPAAPGPPVLARNQPSGVAPAATQAATTVNGTIISAHCTPARPDPSSAFGLTLVVRHGATTSTFNALSFRWEGTGFDCATLSGRRVRIVASGNLILQLVFMARGHDGGDLQ